MLTITLNRVAQSDKGTFGVLLNGELPLCVTCELPWKDNQHKISCIPAGSYPCVRYNSARFKKVWEVTGVPNRDAILLHNGNTIHDVEGCILVGQGFFHMENLPAISNSLATLELLRATLPEEFMLIIKESFQ